MLRRLRIRNFKGWEDTGTIELGSLLNQVFFGANSSGKSSINHFLMMLKQTVRSPDRETMFSILATSTLGPDWEAFARSSSVTTHGRLLMFEQGVHSQRLSLCATLAPADDMEVIASTSAPRPASLAERAPLLRALPTALSRMLAQS